MEKKLYLRPAINIHEYEQANLLAGSLGVFNEEANGSQLYINRFCTDELSYDEEEDL
ncbi:MAG: hypothetical protein ACI4BA_04350 [Prevotella sp.]